MQDSAQLCRRVQGNAGECRTLQSTAEHCRLCPQPHGRVSNITIQHNLLGELGYTFSSPHTLYIDNQSAISVSHNPEHHGRMKHLDLKFFWLRDEVTEKKSISTVHCPTNCWIV